MSHQRLPLLGLPFIIAVLLFLSSFENGLHAQEIASTDRDKTEIREPAKNLALKQALLRARELKLSADKKWKALMHQAPVWGIFWQRSLIDNPDFFLSPAGKYDAQKELEATLGGIFQEVAVRDEHVRCLYPARTGWLAARLNLGDHLPPINCPRLETWLEALQGRRLTLVFPSAFINRPASMFGHTLLRIDTHQEDEHLLAYAVNFAAMSDTNDNALFYALKGLFGGYPGRFSLEPYYEKVVQYSDLENRDIWEYELNFTPDEVKEFLLHVWEMRLAQFDYHYLDENCSYHLLSLLDIVRPDLGLTDPFLFWAIPIDTLREVKERGLVTDASYRASHATKLAHLMKSISPDSQVLALRLAKADDESSWTQALDESAKLPLREQAGALELAISFLMYEQAAGRRTTAQDDKLRFRILSQLSQKPLKQGGQGVDPGFGEPAEPQHQPEDGHKSGRLSLGAMSRDQKSYWMLGLRPAYHDLLDPREGYLEGAQIQFFDLNLSQTEGENVRVERFVPLDILSVAPRNDFIRPLSWSVSTGVSRRFWQQEDAHHVGALAVGLGLGLNLRDRGLGYALFEPAVEYSEKYESHFVFGLGVRSGIFADYGDRVRLSVEGQARALYPEDSIGMASLAGSTRVTLSKDLAFVIKYSRNLENDYYYAQTSSALNFYW